MSSEEPIAAQIDEIYRHRVLRARERDPIEKMWDGPRIYEMAHRVMRAGAAHQKPGVPADEEINRRMKLAEILDAKSSL